jgi:SAM-dependent MidA family methyltransferase
MQPIQSASVSAALPKLIHAAIARDAGWLPFDRFMALALYAPGLGYYANHGRALAAQVAQALDATGTREVWEFGAGSGALAQQLLDALAGLGQEVEHYTIVDLSGTLRERQRERLAAFGERVRWVDALPDAMQGVIVGNEVLDAMPVQLLQFDGVQWRERGVVAAGQGFAWADRPTALNPPIDGHFSTGTVTEIHPQAEAFIATLAERLTRGAAFFIDYGFPEAEYYHPQRDGGTLMCHRAHLADTDPLVDIGAKDITAHVDFTGIALAAQNAGLEVIGYTTQAHFLINCGLMELLHGADMQTTANAQKLLTEHEMGELFKVIGFSKGAFDAAPIGFTNGDRTHTL